MTSRARRRPRLLAAGQRARRPGPLVDGEAEAAQRRIDALVERVPAEHVELMLQVGVGGLGHAPGTLELGELRSHRLEMGGTGTDGRPQVGRRHEDGIEMRFLREHPERQAAFPRDRAAVWLVEPDGQPHERRLAGAVRPDEADPIAERDRRIDGVEDGERPDLAGDAHEPQDRHQPAPSPIDARALARRFAAARFVRSVFARRASRVAASRASVASPGVRPVLPSPAANSVQRLPLLTRPPAIPAGSPPSPCDRPPAVSGTTSRSASSAPR